ncbi:MAG: hypothetical protein ACR2L0_05225 [Gaiellaceae bacterium]
MSETIRSEGNPRITLLLRAFTIVETIVLAVAGLSLLFLPGWTHRVWPWELTPFNTRFLGCIYLASLVSVASLVVFAHWAPARLVAPMIFAFTTTVLIVSILYTSRFEDRLSTIGWWIIFIITPLKSAYFLWRYRRMPPALATGTSRVLSGILALEAFATGVYGALLVATPAWSTSFWPWPIDAFHGRLYSAVFLTLAVGSYVVLRRASPNEFATLGATQVTLGLTAIAGLVIMDADVQKVDWAAAGTWVWVAGFAVLALAGIWLIARGLAGRSVGARKTAQAEGLS